LIIPYGERRSSSGFLVLLGMKLKMIVVKRKVPRAILEVFALRPAMSLAV
jgi:hypothetical protein